MKCNQSGRQLLVSIDNLSKEGGESLEIEDIFKGSTVIYEDHKGKTFDVTIQANGRHVPLHNYLSLIL